MQEFKEYYAQIYGPDKKISFKSAKNFEDQFGKYRFSQVDDVWNISAVFSLVENILTIQRQNRKFYWRG